MKIEMNLFASLSRYMPDKTGRYGNQILEITERTTIVEILKGLGVPL
jgi:hypothetical protein